jgi:hypothetical protein
MPLRCGLLRPRPLPPRCQTPLVAFVPLLLGVGSEELILVPSLDLFRLFGARQVLTPLSVMMCTCSGVAFVTVARRPLSLSHAVLLFQVAGFLTMFVMQTRSPLDSRFVIGLVVLSVSLFLLFAAASIRVMRLASCILMSLSSAMSSMLCSSTMYYARNSILAFIL